MKVYESDIEGPVDLPETVSRREVAAILNGIAALIRDKRSFYRETIDYSDDEITRATNSVRREAARDALGEVIDAVEEIALQVEEAENKRLEKEELG